jgi:hypothetical protein
MQSSVVLTCKTENCTVLYKISDKFFGSGKKEALAAAEALLVTQDKTARLFSDIVIARSLTTIDVLASTGNIRISDPLTMLRLDGSHTIECFISLMKYETSLDQGQWVDFLRHHCRCIDKENKKKS